MQFPAGLSQHGQLLVQPLPSHPPPPAGTRALPPSSSLDLVAGTLLALAALLASRLGREGAEAEATDLQLLQGRLPAAWGTDAAAAAEQGGGAASAERAAALRLMAEKEARVLELRKTLAQYADSDPRKLEAVAEAAELAKDAANRWLDNCFNLRAWMEARFEGRGEEVRAFFEQSGLKEDADYL